jgi:asparagine synthase (glutamine-hydrolysing)
VCALASKYIQKLHTFSIGLEGSPDLVYAQKVANHIGSKHTSVIVTEDEFLSAIPDVIRIIESYDVTTVRASVGNYLIAKYIRENTDFKVVLNGDYSDEVCGGYLYFKMAPTNQEFDAECERLLSNIHYYDSLRSDRCISANGLEARCPFADREFVEYYVSMYTGVRSCDDKIEKHALRNAFHDTDILPHDVLWRQKEAFSDGVSKSTRSWKDIIQEYLGDMTEKEYYKSIFIEHYGRHFLNIIPGPWMPRFCNATDPSARTLQVYAEPAT